MDAWKILHCHGDMESVSAFFFFFFLFNDVSHFLTLLIFSRQEEKFKRINTETQRNVKVYF